MDLITVLGVGATIIAAFGGAGIILIGVSSWLGKVWANRILESDRNKYKEKIENISHHLSIRKTAYDRYLDLIVEYHDLIYQHYRLCQQTERADVIRHPDREDLYTKQNFMENIDVFVDKLKTVEGKLRIILPQEILEIHNDLIGEFNSFGRIVRDFDNDAQSMDAPMLNTSMEKIVDLQKKLEGAIRSLLRTKNVLP